MGGPITFPQLLLLSAFGIVFLSSVASATDNTTQGLLTPANSSTSQESCPGAALLDSSRSIFAAVDSLVGELSCKRKENGSQSEDPFMEVEQNIQRIVESSIKVFSDLGTNLSGSDVLEQIGILDSLSVDNYNDPAFIRLWFSLKMTFLLPFVTDSFLFQLGNKNFSCSSFQELVKSLSERLETSQTTEREQIYSNFIRVYLTRKEKAEAGCTENVEGSEDWLDKNIQSFLVFATLQDLKTMNRNFSGSDVLEKLSPQQRAELILDPDSGALEDADFVRLIIKNVTMSGDDEQLNHFFQKFSILSKETNTTYIQNVAVRETIFNLTLSSLALKFDVFEVQDYQLWFQVYLIPVIASIQPDSLQVIPRNISCESYGAIVTGLMESLKILPLDVSMDVRSSLESLQEAFPDCATLDSFTCKDTHVDEKLICSEVDSSRLQALENDNSPGAVCNFTVTEHACAPTRRLSAEILAKLLKCSLESNQMYVVEVWQLLFQKASPVLSQALASFSDMAPTAMSAAYSNPLDALREVVAKNLTQDQLKSEDFVKSWFQARLGPFLASPSTNFLFCLGTYNFSCQTYQIVIGAFSNQSPLMDVDRKRAVFTHFIQPFLSRKDLPDPGCVSSANSSQLWLQANLGNFSQFASVGDLQALYPNFSSAEALSKLSPSQVAELLLSTDISNDTQFVDKVFERLEVGNAVENVDAFFTKLTEKGEVPEFQVDVRDRIMNKTYIIIGPFFPEFPEKDLFDWFHVKLVPVLPSFTPQMLQGVITNINCTKYQVIVSGMGKVVSAVGQDRQKEIAAVLLQYLKNSADVINQPACRENIQTDSQWVETNLGPFSPYATYSELKFFNLSQSAILDSLSPGQKAEFLLQPDILANVSLVVTVFERFTASASLENLESFFNTFVDGLAKQNLTAVNASMRENILNLTITALAPKFYLLNLEGFRLWFQIYLPLFLPSVKSTTFEIIPRNISCSSYQQVIKGLDNIISQLSKAQNQEVLKFGLDYLKAQLTSGLSCVDAGTEINDRSWLEDNFGQFRLQASFKDFLSLKKDFKGAEVADLLTLSQLKELAATPSQLNGTQDVTKVMTVIEPADFAAFFDSLSQAVVAKSVNYSLEVKSAFLQEVFNRGGLPAVSDEDFLQWLRRLQPLLTDLSPNLVPRLFSLAANRSCATSHETMNVLDTIQTTLSNNTKTEVYRNILIFLQDSTPLKCYSGGSFYLFLQNFFLSFGFPDVATFISLLPPKRESELLNTISTSELSQFLNQPDVVSNNTDICIIFSNYNNTPSFLENEDVPDDVRRIILPCVWPLALSSNRRSEVDLWFNVRLRSYLRFLTKDLISFNKVQNSSCLAFQKLVSFMGKNFTYTGSDFGQPDVYAVIRSYLGAESAARCYNPTDPDLNSTSWFVNYISTFVIFITLDDFKGFVNISQVNVFLEDKANLELFNNAAIPQDVTDYYILQLYEFYPSFGLIMLPGSLLCSPDIPSSLFASLNEADTMAILDKLKRFCNSTENPERSAALASNIKVITAQTFADLGSASSGLTNSQILSVPPEVLVSSLSILGSVNTWGQDQASNIIHSIISSGFQINSSASLASLGTLIIGVPSKSINSISASEALRASKNPMLVSNMLEAPKVVQEIFVKKIISVDSSPAKVVQNVPDALATEIPPSLLVFSEGTANITVINKKTWTADQSTMFFPTLAEADFDTEQLSPFVLQGFTCGTVKKMTKPKISQLIHACRPRKGRAKVELKEPQLTCMYNLIRGDLSQNFTDYPSDMLLYLDSENVQKANCRSYFSALGATDFSVASSILNKGPKKFREARDCLGISGVSLSRDNVEVLGNMVCTLDRSDIENSDPLILEKLKACKDLSASQVAAMETLLLSGKTQYGAVNSWDQQTLQGLGTLPLYLTRNIWTHFTATTTKRFLKGFMPELRKQKTEKKKLKTLFSELAPTVAKRGAGCSEGNITQVTVSDPSFPFGYNQLQFELCLDVPILKDNLHSICQKVDDDGYQRIILNKLNQAFPSGVPDQEVQMLASVSRSATLDDISKWNITELDTLAALMKPEDGTWETAQSKAIITKYLKASGNSLDSSELNIIDSNLCSLDTSTLQTITADSMRNTKHLDVASCSTEQKRVLYEISNTSFSVHRDNPINYYNLVKGYLGGAPRADIAALSRQNISMDVDTFRSLDINVITNLTVANVQGLMGENLRDLKLFENDTVVQIWVNLQLQSDLDTLGLGLITTRADPTVPTATNSTEPQGNTNGSNTTPATTAIPSQSATTSGVLEFTKSPASVLLTALLTAALQIILQPA
ncbi:PREDICTED: uncharacterized protein LOC106909037 [Poecilia mexicana]|nr:PREDICTED: uncharacterized protein LOC106909037 [Poecilia mexicana]